VKDVDNSLAGGWIEVAHVVQPAATSWSVCGRSACSPRDQAVTLSSWEPICGAGRRDAARAVMVLLSLHGLAAAQIAAPLDCHLAMVRRFDREGLAGPALGAGGSGWAGYEQNLWNAL